MYSLLNNRFRLIVLIGLVFPLLGCGGRSTAATGQQSDSSRIVEVTRIVEVVVTATPTLGSIPTDQPATLPIVNSPKFDVINVESRVTETNNTWWKYAWILTLQSQSDHRLLINASIDFVDADGFIVDNDQEYGLLLEPWETRRFSGFKLITSSVAGNVASVHAKANIADQTYVAPTELRPTQVIMPEVTDVPPTQPLPVPVVELPTATPTPATAPLSSDVMVGYATEMANRRSGPGTNFPVTGRAEVGEQLIIVEIAEDNTWYKLQEGDWISAALVNIADESTLSVVHASPEPNVEASLPLANVDKLNRYMVGNAQPELPSPSSASFDVIPIGREDNIVYIFIRNNTSITYRRLGVDVVARQADGTMLAVDESMGSDPKSVGPGEVAFSYVYFSDISLPTDVQFEWEVGSTALGAGENTGDLVVAEHSRVENRFVGMLSNQGSEIVKGPIEAIVLCFDESNRFLNDYSDFTTKSEVAPGAAIPFQVNVREPCQRYLIFASGYTF